VDAWSARTKLPKTKLRSNEEGREEEQTNTEAVEHARSRIVDDLNTVRETTANTPPCGAGSGNLSPADAVP
jgi:hypothetical protein